MHLISIMSFSWIAKHFPDLQVLQIIRHPVPQFINHRQRNSLKPGFLIGTYRLGTTLLQYMLRSHPRISLPTGESHFFVPIYLNRKQYGDLKRPDNIRRVLQEMYRRSCNFLETDLHGIRFDIDSMTKLLYKKSCFTIPAIFSGIYEENARGTRLSIRSSGVSIWSIEKSG